MGDRGHVRRLHSLAVALVAVALVVPAAPAGAVDEFELALHWAPVHHQDTDDTHADADYITTVDFDGDWNTLNNWENQDDDLGRLTAAAYYSVVETPTHWFIVYAFYHPRDSCDNFGCGRLKKNHENDMEGALLTVRKDGGLGRLEAMVTVFHNDFLAYTPDGGGFSPGREGRRGSVLIVPHLGNDARPATMQQAKGHGLEGWDGRDFPGGDGVVYHPSRTASEVPSGGNDRAVAYRLVDVFAPGGLWEQRSNPETFAVFGVFRGDNGKSDAAHAPWRWDDQNDGGDLPGGELATDPARLVAAYFGNLGDFSPTYVRNGYR
jgi:hypothetical protein